MVQDSTVMMMSDSAMNTSMDSMSQAMNQAFDQAMNSPEMQDASGGMLMAILAIVGAYIFLVLGIVAFQIICTWRIFSKSGNPGWASIVPIYNVVIMLKIVGKPWWWMFLCCIPIVNIFLIVMLIHKLSKSFGHGIGFTLGLIFLPYIFLAILAFGSSKYLGPEGAPATATA